MSTNSRSRVSPSANPRLIVGSIAAFAIGVSLAGCPGELDDEARFRVDGGSTGTCDDAMPIFKASCATSGCHNAADKTNDLDLETPGVVARYKGVKAKGGADLLIDPTSPEKSAIYTKTKTPPPFPAQMPIGGTKLTAAQQACIASWIQKELAGAGPADTGTGDMDTGGGADAGGD